MADNHLSEQPVDPELNRRLKSTAYSTPRDPHVAARAKANFIAEVDEIVKEQGFSDNSRRRARQLFTSDGRRNGLWLPLNFERYLPWQQPLWLWLYLCLAGLE